MRKITLFLMSLFLTVGAMAQNVTLNVTPADGSYNKSGWCASWTSNLENYPTTTISVSGGINNMNAGTTSGGFEMAVGQVSPSTWNISVAGCKIVSYSFDFMSKDANNIDVTIGDVTKTSSSEVQTWNVENVNATTVSFQLSGANKCIIVTNLKLVVVKTHIADPAELVNGQIYTFVTTRGWMGAKDDNDNVVSTVYATNNLTGSKDDTNFQWTVYKSKNNNYYLYNIGKEMFMGVQSENNTPIAFVETPAGKNLTFKKSGNNNYPIMFSTNNVAVVNHSANHNPGIVSWTGGWNNPNDDGSNHMVEIVGELDEATLTEIKELVDAYELDNTQAVAALDAAIANAQTLFAQITVGTGMGEYTATDADYETKFNSIVAFRQAIQATNTPTPAEVEAKIGEVDDLVASFQLNLPEAGKYYRIMAVDGWNDDARYLGAKNSTTNTSRAEFVAEADDKTVFYFDGEYLKSNATGYYLVSNSDFLGYNGELTEGSAIAFRAASNNLIGAYNISFNGGARWLYCNQNNFTDAGGSTNNANGYCFNIEEVEVVVEPETPTAIENVETEAENAEIYDLTGRKVENITKAGIYIVNGCKVLVK